MKKFLIVLMFALIGYSAFAGDATDYIEYNQYAYEEWCELVIKYNATQWMDDGDPTWALWELFCEKYPCTDFYEAE